MSITTRPERETEEKTTTAVESHAAILERESEKRNFEIALEMARKQRAGKPSEG